tara:strand:- start:471 stop:668 length:198 start_codon:yes stop_codon:yes gene_type:complete
MHLRKRKKVNDGGTDTVSDVHSPPIQSREHYSVAIKDSALSAVSTGISPSPTLNSIAIIPLPSWQ